MDPFTDELHDQLQNLDTHCQAFVRHGRFTVYKSVSVILRTLLRGSSGDLPLVTHVLPHARLFPLQVTPPDDTPEDKIVLPATAVIQGNIHICGGSRVQRLQVDGGAVTNTRIEELFNSEAGPLSIDEWGEQPFLRPDRTLMQFIAVVAHKDGGVHVDPDDPFLKQVEAWGSFHWHLTLGIGRSVCEQLTAQLQAAFPDYARTVP